jgi:hypothetical protein
MQPTKSGRIANGAGGAGFDLGRQARGRPPAPPLSAATAYRALPKEVSESGCRARFLWALSMRMIDLASAIHSLAV